MTTTDLAVRDRNEIVHLDTEQIRYIANTEFVPAAMRGNLPAIFACIATGREIGIGDMAALRHIHVIDGKPGYSAEIMVVLVRRAGHSITGTTSDTGATVTGKRGDNGDEITFTFDTGMAERAGLLNKGNWRKYPEAMFWARAVSQVCRMLFADCFAGATYTPDELEAEEPQGSGVPAAHDNDLSQTDNGESKSASSATDAQKKKLNVLVGQLRDRDQRIRTEHLWQLVSREKDMERFVTEDLEIRWSPLRDMLTKDEASFMIDVLEKFQSDPDAVWSVGSSSASPGVGARTGLTMTELKRNVADFGVTAEEGQRVMDELFPGRSTSELTDEERLQVWLGLQPLKFRTPTEGT